MLVGTRMPTIAGNQPVDYCSLGQIPVNLPPRPCPLGNQPDARVANALLCLGLQNPLGTRLGIKNPFGICGSEALPCRPLIAQLCSPALVLHNTVSGLHSTPHV
jgi:hypothetical protein